MNALHFTRRELKLSVEEFALLLGVSKSLIDLEELRENDKGSLTWALGMLIQKNPRGAVKEILEKRLERAKDDDREALTRLTTILHERQII